MNVLLQTKETVHCFIFIAALPEVSVPLQDLVVETGLEVILKCSIQAVPPTLEVFWQRNTNDYQTIIKATSLGIGGSTVNNPSLTIQKTSASMSGEYACIARNSIGTARSLLTVLKGKIKNCLYYYCRQ